MERTSFTLDEIRAIKKAIAYDAPYAERISLGFAFQLFTIKQSLGEDHVVLREIDVLEGVAVGTSTKEAERFKRAPLHPFWHKHFSSPRHLYKNIGIRWGIDKDGNRDLSKMIEEVAAEHGDNPDIWQKLVPYKFVMDAFRDRIAAKRMTGDWIIFAKHEGANFYLDLATHEEGRNPELLMEKLRNGSACEFPFLFPDKV